ncbi:hypothetical protein [Flagellimonas pacifica]|uniref:Transporter n=1 Tax=Flagellimonas pacifica TaxID=1247520 RepID=A0A285MBF1_9FLAO|nr:hypothetical protein [Allomuricauda parva]SNY94522.1 hypothetical protein SAMN06265377_0182 [Allomuricauda parva]
MKKIKYQIFLTGILLCSFIGFSQDDQGGSNIQNLTPSKLIGKGQWDIKWFNNLYTQTKAANGNRDVTKNLPRETFFTSTIDIFTGVGENKRVNVGLLLEFRSNTTNDRGIFDFLSFDGEEGTARSGFTSFAPAIKFVPFKNVNNFSVQSAFFIPLVDNETETGVFLDQKGYTWQNRFFYDHTFPGKKWQLFSEINSELNFGKEGESFANNSLRLTPGVFLSYFPSSDFTILGLVQHSQLLDLGNNFTQNFTAVGGGVKFQLSQPLNLELLYTNFVRGNDTGLGQTFNIGLRAVL